MPPLVGAVTVTVAWPLPAIAVGAPGVAGAVAAGVADTSLDATELPTELIASTVK